MKFPSVQGTTSASCKLTPELTHTSCLLDSCVQIKWSWFRSCPEGKQTFYTTQIHTPILKSKEMGIRDVGFHLHTTKGIEAPVPEIKINLFLTSPLMVYPREQGWE